MLLEKGNKYASTLVGQYVTLKETYENNVNVLTRLKYSDHVRVLQDLTFHRFRFQQPIHFWAVYDF